MQTLSQFQARFQQYLADNPFTKSPEGLYEPVDYILSLGGKRLRPVLAMMSCALFDDSGEKALPAALAVEVFHNFTLLHDDIMDDAPLRRGQATVHEKYSTNTAILSGDVMMILSYEMLRQTERPALLNELLAIFNKTAIEVCEGQQFDMEFETREDVTIPEYLKMIELKTAVLLACGLHMGARIGGASVEDAQHLYEFGRNVGIAFQLQDDLLDTFGDPEKFGKKVGGDIVQNKKTYLVLKALEVADEATKKQLNAYMNTPTTDEQTKIEAVRKLFNQLNIRQLANEVQLEYQKAAFTYLERVNAPVERKKVLRNLAEELLMREV